MRYCFLPVGGGVGFDVLDSVEAIMNSDVALVNVEAGCDSLVQVHFLPVMYSLPCTPLFFF